jgi:membrane dipeptidase
MTSQLTPLIWDAHACFALNPEADLSQLERYRKSGVNFVSVNVGMDVDAFDKTIQVLAGFREFIKARPDDYVLALSTADILAARDAGRLAVAFDLEGSEPLAGNLNMVSFFYDLGVRQMLLAYNQDNRACGGCLEDRIGLTDFGRRVIAEMNRVGMVVDVTHVGFRACMEIFALSRDPVIFSHSNPRGLHEHVRNISDELIVACARTGGVVGINGVGDFLGDTSSETVVANTEYVMNLVGPEHVGLGLDYVVDQRELFAYFKSHPDRFPADPTKDTVAFVQPEQHREIAGLLLARGHSEAVVRNVMGENFFRVARQVWKNA